MNLFPISCVDNFYSNPDKVRDYALSLEYGKVQGNFPGERSEYLDVVNQNFFHSFCKRLFSVYFDFYYTTVKWEVSTNFQKIYPHSNPLLNTGWQHVDTEFIAAGLIYLNKESYLDSGTSFYRMKKENEYDDLDYNIRNDFYGGKKISDEEYLDHLNKHGSKFEKTLEVKNVYNRMIIYDSDTFHKESSFYANEFEPRLTQVFFVHSIECESIPLQRKNEYEIEF